VLDIDHEQRGAARVVRVAVHELSIREPKGKVPCSGANDNRLPGNRGIYWVATARRTGPASRTPPKEVMSQVLPVVQPVVLRDRDAFLRTLLRHLTGALQDVIGLEEASGF